MAIPHAKPCEVIDLSPSESKNSESQTTTLFKTGHVEVLRLVLPAGKRIEPHEVAGEVIVQCLEGTVEFEARGKQQLLTPGTLLYLLGGDKHAVRAVDASVMLLTILLPGN